MTAGILFTLMSLIFVLALPPGLSFGAASPDRMKVFVSIPPQAYFVNRIGGERVNVTVLLAPGENPSTFSPSPQEMAELARADLFFRTGVPFENVLMPKIASAMPGLKVVDTRQGEPTPPP
ncbi:MAG: zinc ABC transporter substrate-binding protein [Deltaproteobacteria bacterium]